jgi:endonuclease/exonuclease/phosphatase family metal-dependent hydrolase
MKKIGVVLAVFFYLTSNAQEQATVMSYNVLNFPTGNIAGREDTLRQLINYIEPDLFLMQELKNDSGLQLILNESFSDLPANYAASTFLTQQSNPTSGFKLQQAIIYNSDMLGLAKEGFVQTQTRDINRFKMYYRAPDLSTGADTIFIYVYVAHLKSSQGTSNQEERLSNAQSFASNLGNLPADANVILAGDFNVYDSAEPAYQELLDSTNFIQMIDPINSPGDWSSSSFEPKNILTQSTRSSSIFGDGAGGGLDDRFDFILVSDNMMQPWNTIVFEPESYYAMGNTGTCYNQSITDCSGGEWPDEILQSLYYMSDHLPVIMTLNLGVGNVGVEGVQVKTTTLLWTNESLYVDWDQEETVQITVTDLLGRACYEAGHTVLNGTNIIALSEVANMKGLMLIRVSSATEQHTLKVVR